MSDINIPSAPANAAPSNGASHSEQASRRTETTRPRLQQNRDHHADDRVLSNVKPACFPWIEAAMGCLGIFVFITLIDIGYVVSSATYRTELASPQHGPLPHCLYLLTMIGLSYTVSNVAMLCCLSAFMGALGERTGIMGRVKKHDANYWQDGVRQYTAAILRGMFVFLVLMSGMLALGSANFTNPTQAGYGNLAGTAALFSFLIGRDPRMFSKIVEKVNGLEFEKEDPNHPNAAHPAPGGATLDKDRVTTEVKRTEEHVHAEAGATAVVSAASTGPVKT